jgi:hypothetical protein
MKLTNKNGMIIGFSGALLAIIGTYTYSPFFLAIGMFMAGKECLWQG